MVFVFNAGWLQATQRLAWFDIDKLAVEFPNAPYLIFLACVRQLSCRPFAPKNGVPTHISILYYYEWSTCTCLYVASLCWKHRSLDVCFTRGQSWSLCSSHLPWHFSLAPPAGPILIFHFEFLLLRIGWDWCWILKYFGSSWCQANPSCRSHVLFLHWKLYGLVFVVSSVRR